MPLFCTRTFFVLGWDCDAIPVKLKTEKTFAVSLRLGVFDSRRYLVKIAARHYQPMPKFTDGKLTRSTYITPDGIIFTYLSDQGKNKQTVGKLIFVKKLNQKEMTAYLSNLMAQNPAFVEPVSLTQLLNQPIDDELEFVLDARLEEL